MSPPIRSNRWRCRSVLLIGFWLMHAFWTGCVQGQETAGTETPRTETAGTETAGRFGLGWDASKSAVYQAADQRLATSPLTIELWVKASAAGTPHVFLSHGLQTSGDHWEIGADRDGHLYCDFAAVQPARIVSKFQIADNQWHYLACQWSDNVIRVVVDRQRVIEQTVQPNNLPRQAAGLWLGARGDEKQLTSLVLDDVRISAKGRDILTAPEQPLSRDNDTLYLWDFEESREAYLARWTPGGETNQRNLPYPHRIAEYEFEDDSHWVDGRWQDTVKGPFLAHTFQIDNLPLGPKSIAVFLNHNGTAVFNVRDCALAAGLSTTQLQINPARFGLLAKPKISGQLLWYHAPGNAWLGRDDQGQWQPLAADKIDYQGLSVHGQDVVFSYRIAETAFREHCQQLATAATPCVLRRWQVDPVVQPISLILSQNWEELELLSDRQASGVLAGRRVIWRLSTATSPNVRLMRHGKDLALSIAANSESSQIELAVEQLGDVDGAAVALAEPLLQAAFADSPALDQLQSPGPARWGEPLITTGSLGPETTTEAWVIDELTLPVDNPQRALFFVSGFDFLSNGDAMICTAHGDVWRVSGIDDTLTRITWQRFATGLYQPLGLKVLNDQVFVVCRDQILRLDDLNEDGEADRYHCLNHELHTLGSDHAYAMRLESDRQGNLYFLKSSEGPPHGCSLIRCRADTGKLEVVASGFRHPYGLGIGPHDELTVADNEGNWVPSSKIDWIEPGNFYGFIERPGDVPDTARPTRPLCFIPKFLDNSSGGQVWVPTDHRWGSYHAGEMLHLSWGRCTLHAVLRQQEEGIRQAATVRLPELVFRSGSGTGRFRAQDGQLYVAGLDGWQTGAVQDGCFSRVRATGQQPRLPTAWAAYPNGLKISYSVDLDTQQSTQASRFSVEQWNYRWSGTYGSFHYRLTKPDEVGHDTVLVKRVVSIDSRTLFIETEPLQLVDQIQLNLDVVTAVGQSEQHQIVGTINQLPPPFDLPESSETSDLFRLDNLVAWCVVPFDAQRRGPAQRAAMLRDLGLRHLAYDWRDEHIATWDEEVAVLRAAGIDLTAFWAPANTAEPWNESHWREIFALIDRHQLHMDLWVMLNESLLATISANDRVDTAARWLAPLAAELKRRQCRLALYNHGGWCGQPENMVAIVAALQRSGHDNVGIVYNLHHGHDHLANLTTHLQAMRPHLYCLNLNGMQLGGPKILPIGAGTDDQAILDKIFASGYRGRIGILDHREELDARESLQQNLDGLHRLRKSLSQQK